jgi:hypothetical protein
LWESITALRLPRRARSSWRRAPTIDPGVESIPNAEDALRHRGVQSAWRVEVDAQVGVLVLTPRVQIDRLCALLTELAKGPSA